MQIEAETILFGFPSTPAVLSVRSRSTSWRAAGAAAFMGGGMVAAAVLAVVPPHAPWLLGALVVGAVLARRRWMERYTLDSLTSACPKCGEALKGKPGRLKMPHPVPCESCHHQSTVRIEPSLLGGLA